MKLHVLLVEDDPEDLSQFQRSLPPVFAGRELEVELYPYQDFDEARQIADDPSRCFDLIISDTYKGDHRTLDAAVITMVSNYRTSRRFCPIVVYSSAVKPTALKEGPFVVWADKSRDRDVERAIGDVLSTGLPQLARSLRDELHGTAGEYMWGFLESNWGALTGSGHDSLLLERLIRRRAATQLACLSSANGSPSPLSEIDGPEHYIYPPLGSSFSHLGEIIRKQSDHCDLRVILTPHCHLRTQQDQSSPRDQNVLIVKTCSAEETLGGKLENARQLPEGPEREKKLRQWATRPSRQTVGKPEGRYWYLPAFLAIPHCFCDFQLVESVSRETLQAEFEPIAVLAPPFAESLQACFVRYYGSIGLPDIRPGSIGGLLDTP